MRGERERGVLLMHLRFMSERSVAEVISKCGASVSTRKI